jgi:tetratricopeptide (TPR) repeat protein
VSWTHREPDELELSTELATALGKLRTNATACPKPEVLQAALYQVLPSEAAKEVNQHLEGCRLCQTVVADLEALDSGDLDSAARQRIWKRIQPEVQNTATDKPVRSRWNLWLRPLPLAAGALAVLALVVGLGVLRDRRQPAPTTAQNQIPVAPPTPNALRLEKPPIILPAASVIVWRGEKDDSIQRNKELKQALAPYEVDNYAEAAHRLDRLRKKHPRLAEAPFYLGVSQLFLNQNEDATKSLKDAVNLADQPLADEATWYLALALSRTGRNELASSLLEQLCHGGGKDSGRACLGIKELQARH